MCGIIGIWDTCLDSTKEESFAIANEMANSIKSRGPDDNGVWVDSKSGLTFGHRRLSIIDLSSNGCIIYIVVLNSPSKAVALS